MNDALLEYAGCLRPGGINRPYKIKASHVLLCQFAGLAFENLKLTDVQLAQLLMPKKRLLILIRATLYRRLSKVRKRPG
jgi:hypothetical protein